jgi:hypothetical protein
LAPELGIELNLGAIERDGVGEVASEAVGPDFICLVVGDDPAGFCLTSALCLSLEISIVSPDFTPRKLILCSGISYEIASG